MRNEYKGLISRLEAKGLLEGLEGVIIQEMVKGSREMVCGIATDPQYGPMMMFGLGGVFVEVEKIELANKPAIKNISLRKQKT